MGKVTSWESGTQRIDQLGHSPTSGRRILLPIIHDSYRVRQFLGKIGAPVLRQDRQGSRNFYACHPISQKVMWGYEGETPPVNSIGSPSQYSVAYSELSDAELQSLFRIFASKQDVLESLRSAVKPRVIDHVQKTLVDPHAMEAWIASSTLVHDFLEKGTTHAAFLAALEQEAQQNTYAARVLERGLCSCLSTLTREMMQTRFGVHATVDSLYFEAFIQMRNAELRRESELYAALTEETPMPEYASVPAAEPCVYTPQHMFVVADDDWIATDNLHICSFYVVLNDEGRGAAVHVDELIDTRSFEILYEAVWNARELMGMLLTVPNASGETASRIAGHVRKKQEEGMPLRLAFHDARQTRGGGYRVHTRTKAVAPFYRVHERPMRGELAGLNDPRPRSPIVPHWILGTPGETFGDDADVALENVRKFLSTKK